MQNQWLKKVQEWLEKMKNSVLQKDKMLFCIVVGLLLFIICLPVKSTTSMKNEKQNDKVEIQKDSEDRNQDFAKIQENRLRNVLEKMDGVGQVEVMITLKTSTVKVLAKDEPYESSKTVEEDGVGGKRTIEEKNVQTATIYGKNDNGETQPVIIQELQPEIEGVLIVAEGGDNKKIQIQINEAVQALFGIEAHKITIVKRKA